MLKNEDRTKCDVKPSQQSGVIYKTWVAAKKFRSSILTKCDVKPSQCSGVTYKTWVAVKHVEQFGVATALAWLA